MKETELFLAVQENGDWKLKGDVTITPLSLHYEEKNPKQNPVGSFQELRFIIG